MEKRIFIVHGFGAIVDEGWLGWLRRELETQGFLVASLQMPNTNKPEIQVWVNYLKNAVGSLDENTFFIGHSIGCQAIARYLESLPVAETSGGAIFVSGFFKRLTIADFDDESKKVLREWLDAPINLIVVKRHLLKSIAIFSDDDPYVPIDNVEEFKYIIGSEIIIEHKQGHFSSSSGLPKYPSVLNVVLGFLK